MVRVTHGSADRLKEYCGERNEHQRHTAYHSQSVAVDHFPVFAFFRREAEKRCLHPESQQCKEEGRIGVEIGDYAVAAALRRDFPGVERHQQVVQETPDYAAQTVDGRVLGQGFQIHGSKDSKTG